MSAKSILKGIVWFDVIENYLSLCRFSYQINLKHKTQLLLILVYTQNECSDTVHKKMGDLSKRSPTYSKDAVPLCDRYLMKHWYVALHYEMPTTAPSLGTCGTTYPIWLNGVYKNIYNKWEIYIYIA